MKTQNIIALFAVMVFAMLGYMFAKDMGYLGVPAQVVPTGYKVCPDGSTVLVSAACPTADTIPPGCILPSAPKPASVTC